MAATTSPFKLPHGYTLDHLRRCNWWKMCASRGRNQLDRERIVDRKTKEAFAHAFVQERIAFLTIVAFSMGTLFSMNFPAAPFRLADYWCSLLAELNHQLIRDEGHRNKMTVPELEQRMKGWLASEYAAVIFEEGKEVVAYALYREEPEELYLRQLFVVRNRRRQGIGRTAMEILRTQIWPKNKRLTVSVLVNNPAAVAFWRAVGYKDYSLSLEILPVAKS